MIELTARHRKCLQKGSLGGPNGENEAQLYTGQKVRQECLDQGWLERLPDSLIGTRMYKTTELGRAMLATLPAKKSAALKLKMLKSRVATLDTRAAKPIPRKR